MTNETNQVQPEKMTISNETIDEQVLIASEEEGEVKVKRVRLRLIPIWLRVLLVICLLVGVSVIGLVVGYSGLGDGDAADALKWKTWQHIIDIIRGVEK